MTVDLEQRPLRGVVIGGSAGSVDVLTQLLPALPSNTRVPVLVVIHVPPDRTSSLPALYQARCALDVREAIDKEDACAGTVLFAPPDYHLLVERDGTVSLSLDAAVHFSRPAIDVLFESAAWAWGDQVLGVVLTGASEDGAAGLEAIAAAGGLAWVQDPTTAYSAVMPAAARRRVPDARAMTVDEMVEAIGLLGSNRRSNDV